MNNEHESIRALLPLAAAGGLSHDESLRVDRHVRECAPCRQESETWGIYSTGLRRLPQPEFPRNLMARTQARILQERALQADRRFNAWVLASLALLSWVPTLAFWRLAWIATGGTLDVLGLNLVSLGPWLAVSTTVAWMTAGTAAAALGTRREVNRRTL